MPLAAPRWEHQNLKITGRSSHGPMTPEPQPYGVVMHSEPVLSTRSAVICSSDLGNRGSSWNMQLPLIMAWALPSCPYVPCMLYDSQVTPVRTLILPECSIGAKTHRNAHDHCDRLEYRTFHLHLGIILNFDTINAL